MTDPYHYALVARAIAVLRQSDHVLDLAELSETMGLSPAHLQRVFTAWAGISPLRFQQHEALRQVKAMLSGQASMMQTAHSAGLSGTGRLHDLMITWEAMTPGTYAKQGEGLTIKEAHVPSPFGPALIMATDKGICGLAFTEAVGPEAARQDMQARWPKARFVQDNGQILAVSPGLWSQKDNVALHMMGRPFHLKVWQALIEIPESAATSYGQIAKAIGSPGAARAVGSAVGANPVSLLIPCHRVLRSDGALGGYHWGPEVKQAILAREAIRHSAP